MWDGGGDGRGGQRISSLYLHYVFDGEPGLGWWAERKRDLEARWIEWLEWLAAFLLLCTRRLCLFPHPGLVAIRLAIQRCPRLRRVANPIFSANRCPPTPDIPQHMLVRGSLWATSLEPPRETEFNCIILLTLASLCAHLVRLASTIQSKMGV